MFAFVKKSNILASQKKKKQMTLVPTNNVDTDEECNEISFQADTTQNV